MTDGRFQFLVIVISAISAATIFAIKVYTGKGSTAEKLSELINDVKAIKDELTIIKQEGIHNKTNTTKLEILVNTLLENILELIRGK